MKQMKHKKFTNETRVGGRRQDSRTYVHSHEFMQAVVVAC